VRGAVVVTLLVIAAVASAISPVGAVADGGGAAVDGAGDGGVDSGVDSGVGSGASVGGFRYRPPVDRPVIDPFRPPSNPYGPGNRGLEYDTVPGEPVRVIGAGVVAFAGWVAGRGVVSVEHPDGLRSSLTGLESVALRRGDVVAAGTVAGSAGDRLHLGVRRSGRYVDPAALFATEERPRHAVLVPVPSA